MQARRAPQVVKVHDVVKVMIRVHLTLVHIFHVYASVDTPWVAMHYPIVHLLCMVG
jgi:hypothetical protein